MLNQKLHLYPKLAFIFLNKTEIRFFPLILKYQSIHSLLESLGKPSQFILVTKTNIKKPHHL